MQCGFKKGIVVAVGLALVPTFAIEATSKGLFSDKIYKSTVDPSVDFTKFANIKKETDGEVHFSADEMETNSKDNTIVAKGNVNIYRDDIMVIADKVTYYQAEDKIIADGNVILTDGTGSVVYADHINLQEKMDKIDMGEIKVVMVDESKMFARRARKFKNDNKLMEEVEYTPCDFCENKSPLWKIKARKVRHNAETKDVNYNDAVIEVKDVPVFYTPFFSHPDPTVKRRSGLLPPSFNTNNYFGARLTAKYFWSISEHENLLFSPGVSTKVGPVLGVDYDKYFYSGDLKLSSGYIKDTRNKSDYGDGDRGHLFVKTRYEMSENWVANVDWKYVSDRTYLKDLSMPDKDDAWLTSTAKVQGFFNRDYAAVEAFYYKQVSYDLIKEDKPYIVPLVTYQNINEFNNLYGIYNRNDFSVASVYRDDNDSSYRASMINAFILPGTTSYGAKQKLQASVKTDLYYVDNFDNEDGINYDGSVARVFPQLAYEWRMPFVKATETSRQIIEPIIVAVLGPNAGNKRDKIPNNDSENPRLDDTNVLDIDRYSGYDLNDTGSRVSYGLNWSSYGDVFGRSSFLLAQSYKFGKSDDFASDYDRDKDGYFSDYVGRIYANPHEMVDLNYRFIVNKRDYDLDYSELSTRLGSNVLNTDIGYIYIKDYNNRSFSRSNLGERKELYLSVNMALTENWSLTVYNRQDLTKHGGSLEYGGVVSYEDECFKMATRIRKDNSNDPQYKGSLDFTVDFFLKTLGGVGSK